MNDEQSKAIPRFAPIPADLTDEDFQKIEHIVFDTPEKHAADVLFLFGYFSGDWARAADAYKEGMAPLIVATGLYGAGSPDKTTPQAHVIRDALVANGVPLSAIIMEDESTNTLENVTFGKKALDERGVHPKSILFYSKAHHAGRCIRTLRKHFPDARLSCFTFDAAYEGVTVARNTWRDHLLSRERVYGEYLRIQKYSAKGDIAA